MYLPNKSSAVISNSKILDYLLSETHAVGKSKARYFRSFGFDEANTSEFKAGVLNIAETEPVSEVSESAFGIKYVVDGELKTPNGVIIHVRTVWIIESGDTIPKLVTAYPFD
jgi:hypothetical protein